MTDTFKRLRELAEQSVSEKPESSQPFRENETDELIHELRVHQVELRIQNETLRNAQAELEAERQKYEDLFEFAPVGYFVLDKTGRIADANLTGASMLGVQRNRLSGSPFFLSVSPDSRNLFDHHFRAVFESETPQSSELKMMKKDGKPFYVVMESKPARDESGDISLVRITISDISARKLAERQELTIRILNLLNLSETRESMIRDVLDSIKNFSAFEAVGIRLKADEDYPYFEARGFPAEFVEAEKSLCARDSDGKLLRDTDGMPILQCMCGNVICGQTDPSLPFFTENGSFWTNSTSRLLASTTEEDRQSAKRNRCNRKGYESVCLVPIRVGSKTLGLLQLNDRKPDMLTHDLVCFFEEIVSSVGFTLEIMETRGRLRDQQAQLVHAGRLAALGEMAAGVAHELNQPLSIIRLCAESLDLNSKKKNPPDENNLNDVRSIVRNVDRAAHIIKHMQRFARKSGASPSGKFLLKDAVENSLAFFRQQFKKNAILLETDIADDVPALEGDEQKVEQVIVNLLSNAKYAVDEREKSEGGGYQKKVTLRVFHNKARHAVVLELGDNGGGMNDLEKEKCLDPFFTTKAVGDGTGLGLSISHSIIRDFKGELEIESVKGAGTVMRVVFFLPDPA